MISAGIAILTGVLLACFQPREIDAYWLSLLPLVLFLAVLDSRRRNLWLLFCGFLWASLHIHWQLDQRLADELNNSRLTIRGEVASMPRLNSERSTFLFRVESIDGYQGSIPDLVRLSWRQAPPLRPGQHWLLRVKLKQPHGFQNPGGFDYERWMFARGIDASGYVLVRESQTLLGEAPVSIDRLRAAVSAAIDRVCADCPQRGLIQALAIGYRGQLTESQRTLLQQTGTAHLIAISGLHIGIVAGWFYLIGTRIWRISWLAERWDRRAFAGLLGWAAGLLYSLLAGFDLPAQRAMLMLSVVFIGLWSRVPVNLLHSILAALVLVLVVAPLSVLSASFWLTFSALLVISLGAVMLRDSGSALRRLLLIQMLFSLLFIPVSIIIFGQVHAASFLANLVAVPLVSLVIVPANFLLLPLQVLPGDWLAYPYAPLDRLLGWLLSYLDWLREMGLQAVTAAGINPWKLPLILLLLLLLLRSVPAPLAWLMLLPAAILWPTVPSTTPLRMAVLDVGMGTAIVLRTRHHSLVYDFGPGNREGYSLGKWVVQPYLQAEGVDFVDRIVISHADQDHLGGWYAIRHQLNHGALFSGTIEELRARLPEEHTVQDCHRSSDWTWDGIRFAFLSSSAAALASENNRSCVLQVSGSGFTLLISGDIEAAQEQRLLDEPGIALAADILVAPHHGSLTSSSSEFVQAVGASHVIFTAGYLNRWRFPREEVVQRYRSTGSEIHRTDRDGALLVDCENSHCRVRRYRELSPRLWY